MIDWKSLIADLPTGLSYTIAAQELSLPYQKARPLLKKHGYSAKDGRTHCQDHNRKFFPEKADWTKSNLWNAEKQGVSRELVRRTRKRLGYAFVEARGRPRKVSV